MLSCIVVGRSQNCLSFLSHLGPLENASYSFSYNVKLNNLVPHGTGAAHRTTLLPLLASAFGSFHTFSLIVGLWNRNHKRNATKLWAGNWKSATGQRIARSKRIFGRKAASAGEIGRNASFWTAGGIASGESAFMVTCI